MKNVKLGHSTPTVCLDAGHFGKYNPSPVVDGYYEAEMVWELHLKLKSELEKRGIRVVTTRENQATDRSLTSRGKASVEADLFLSLHSNAAASQYPNWVVGMYFVDDDCGKIDEQSREIAEILSKKVASLMGVGHQTYTRKSSKDRDRNGHLDDYYGVLRGAHSVGTPGVILEHGFHTNTENTRWLMIDENLDKLASGEAETIANWFGIGTKLLDFQIPVLKKGCRGCAVQGLQALLRGHGYDQLAIDGSFGGATDRALRDYQAQNNLAVDGSCGRVTWSALLGL
ncbi:MAG: N-acetylmuramoyl-L-alanine amidase [Oscillospiraceae bacterium]|nr:N-acetylmuramoyl-L-alanine amidase [Oscillospiraceae bacterium]